MNEELRKNIARMVYIGKNGHMPSAFSIIDIIEILYRNYLKYDPKSPEWPDRDYFILSKGHGCLALYVILEKYGFITKQDIAMFCKPGGILGEHPVLYEFYELVLPQPYLVYYLALFFL